MKTKTLKKLIILILGILAIAGICQAVEGDAVLAEEVKSEELVIGEVSTTDIEDKLKSQEVILENETYLITDTNISRVKPLTKYADFMSVIKSQLKEEYQNSVAVYKTDRENGDRLEQVTKADEIITTGMELVIVDEEGNDLESYEIIVAGDMTQNGDTSIIELTKVIKHLVELTNWKLEGIEEKAGDITSDGKIGEGDVKEIIWYIVYGIINIGNGEEIAKPEIAATGEKAVEDSEWFKSEVKVTITEKAEETEKTVYQVEGYEAKWYETEGQEKEGKWVKVESQNEKLEKDKKEKTIELAEDGIYKIISQTYGTKGNVEGEAFEINNSRSNKSVSIIRIDKTAPTVEVEPEEIKEGEKIEITITDNIAIAEYTITAPGEEEGITTVLTEEVVEKTIEIAEAKAGEYTILARDIAGNETTKTITVEGEESIEPDAPLEPDTYTVKFIGRNGVDLGEQTIKEGEAATEPEFEKEGNEGAKEKNENDESYGIYYEFTAWSLEGDESELTEEEFKAKISAITEDLTFIANYNETPINPVAKILVEEGKVGNIEKIEKTKYYKSENQEDEEDTTEYYYFSTLTLAITATTDHEELANKTVQEYKEMTKEQKESNQEEIIILKDIDLSETEKVPGTKNIRIDLNNYIIRGTGELDALFYNEGILNVKDRKSSLENCADNRGKMQNHRFIYTNQEKTEGSIYKTIQNNGDLTIRSGIVDFENTVNEGSLQSIINILYANPYYSNGEIIDVAITGNGYAIYNNGNLAICGKTKDVCYDTKVEGEVGIYNSEEANLEIIDGFITGTIGIENYGEMNMKGGIVSAPGENGYGIYSESGIVTVTGGTVSAKICGIYNGSGNIVIGNKEEGDKQDYQEFPKIVGTYAIDGKFDFYDGRLYGNLSKSLGGDYDDLNSIAPGYVLDKNEDEEGKEYYYLLKMIANNPVAQINKNYANVSNLDKIYWTESEDKEYFEYYTIQSAIDAAKSGATIKIVSNRKLPGLGEGVNLIVSEDKEITLDLQGHTISGAKTAVIENNGDLTITDSSGKNGKIEQKEGYYNKTQYFPGFGDYTSTVYYDAIKNNKTVKIDRVIIESAGRGITNSGTATIGTKIEEDEENKKANQEIPEIEGKVYGIYNNGNGTLYFYDGSVYGDLYNYNKESIITEDGYALGETIDEEGKKHYYLIRLISETAVAEIDGRRKWRIYI